jgi:serine/threonine-protein kinase
MRLARARNRETETRKGFLKGTVRYMSPEQCQALRVDRRSDIFSTSILLWELTTGARLYKGESDFEVARMIVEGDAPAPSTVVKGYPRELERIVMKGLSRLPEERWQDAQALQAALESFAREAKLAISSIALGRLLSEAFPDRVQQGEHFRKLAERTSSGLTATPSSHPGELAARHNAPTAEPAEAPMGATTVADVAVTRRRSGRRAILLLGATTLLVTALLVWWKSASSTVEPQPQPEPGVVPAAAKDPAPVHPSASETGRLPGPDALRASPGPAPAPAERAKPKRERPAKPNKPPRDPDKPKPLDPDAPLWE